MFNQLCWSKHLLLSASRDRLEKEMEHISNTDTWNDERLKIMNASNPKYILRNYIAQKAIEAAENDDFLEVNSFFSHLCYFILFLPTHLIAGILGDVSVDKTGATIKLKNLWHPSPASRKIILDLPQKPTNQILVRCAGMGWGLQIQRTLLRTFPYCCLVSFPFSTGEKSLETPRKAIWRFRMLPRAIWGEGGGRKCDGSCFCCCYLQLRNTRKNSI